MNVADCPMPWLYIILAQCCTYQSTNALQHASQGRVIILGIRTRANQTIGVFGGKSKFQIESFRKLISYGQ